MVEENFYPEFEQPELPLNVKLEIFEGPLDLLLHLIKKNEINIYDIPITLITQQYLEYLEMMRNLNLDVAGEFLLMAATLLHIKSKMLLPPAEGVEEEGEEEEVAEDPRAELVRRLLEYQKYKEAAAELAKRDLLEREVFTRKVLKEELINLPGEDVVIGELTLFDLIEALKKVLQRVSPEEFQEISLDNFSLKEKIQQIMELIWKENSISFTQLFPPEASKGEIILSFLALLELLRLRLVKAYQAEAFGSIRIFSPVEVEEGKKFIAEGVW
ncbi:MAG: segregation and condensation protein A [Thermodesulfobacteriota bacterium]